MARGCLFLLLVAMCCLGGASGFGMGKKSSALKPTPNEKSVAPVKAPPVPPAAPAPKAPAIAPANSIPIAGVLTVIGGALAHLTLGSLYCWGNFQTYLPGNLRFFDGKVHPGATDAQLVLPMTILAQCFGLPLGPAFQKLVGERYALLVGSWLMASGVFLSSYATSLPIFMTFYSLLFGIGVGLAYTAPIVAGWKWFPQSKGLVSGAVLTGFGAGGFIFTKLGTALINPDNLQAKGGFFPDSVHDALGPGLRKLALSYFALSAVGSMLVSTPPPAAPATPQRGRGKEVIKEEVDFTPVQAMASSKFWLLWSIIFLVAGGSLSTAGLCKAFGTLYKELNSDAFLSMVVALSALFNGGGRLFWGSMSDKFGFKKAFLALAAIQTLTLGLYDKLTSSRFAFGLGTMSIFFTLGGTFSMFPPLITQVFGAKNGVTIYGYIFTAFAAASILGSLMAKQLVASVGWDQVFKIFALCSAGAFGLANLL